MTPAELQAGLRGVLAFTPTPFTHANALDADSLARHVDFLCASGVQAVFVCGGVGEFFALDPAEYRTCIRVAVEAAAHRVPVVAGIGHDTHTACALASYAEKVGADGLLVHPFYFASPPADGIVRHYRALASACALGMVVYHTKEAVYTAALLARLAEIPSVIALKDEMCDLKTFGEMRERLGDRLAWINGSAELMLAPYLAAGAQAMTTGIVNFAPALSLAVWQAGLSGQTRQLAELLVRQVRPLARLRERRKGYPVAVVKEAMNLLGLPGGGMVRLPLLPMLPADREDLRKTLQAIGLLTGDEP